MGDRLRNALQSTGHNWELYLTLAVSGIILFLKILHIVKDPWVDSAILGTLLLLALGNIRDRAGDKALHRTLETIAFQGSGDENIRWYTLRSQATKDMLADMGSFEHMAFLGISHRQLYSYLDERLRDGTGSLPWESIEVYFASQALGAAYEGAEFRHNLLESRQAIASLLTKPEHAGRLPNLRSIAFYQQNGFATHTGSMFGKSPQKLGVLYAVHSAVRLHGNTNQGLTVRLTASPGLAPPGRSIRILQWHVPSLSAIIGQPGRIRSFDLGLKCPAMGRVCSAVGRVARKCGFGGRDDIAQGR